MEHVCGKHSVARKEMLLLAVVLSGRSLEIINKTDEDNLLDEVEEEMKMMVILTMTRSQGATKSLD
jgi:hypothetical protein